MSTATTSTGTASPAPNNPITAADTHAQIISTLNQLENQKKVALAGKDYARADKLFQDQVKLVGLAGVVEDGRKLQSKMMELVPELRSTAAKELLTVSVEASKKMVSEQHEANLKKQEAYMDEVNKTFQSRLNTAEGPARLMASFKGFAMLLQAFGVDCSEFIANMDKAIDGEYAKVPKKNIEGISSINAYTVDPTGALRATEIGRQASERVGSGVAEVAREAGQRAMGENINLQANMPEIGQSPVATKPATTKSVTSALETLISDKNLITADKKAAFKETLEKGITLAAGTDGNAATVSADDLSSVALRTQRAINKNGGNVDSTQAMALAKEAIDRAMQGIPKDRQP